MKRWPWSWLAILLLAGCVQDASFNPDPPDWPELKRFDPAVADTLQGAREKFEQAVSTHGQATAEDWGQLGMQFHAHHLYPLAEECYRNALQLAPKGNNWRYYLAFVLQEIGRFEEAAAEYRRVIDLRPDFVPAQLRLADTLFKAGDLQGARENWETVIARQPASAAALAGLGRISLAEGDYYGAIDRLQRALQLQPGATRLYHPLAMALRGQGDAEAAAAALEKRGDRNPGFNDPLMEQLSGLSQSAQYYLVPALKAAKAGRHAEAAGLFRKVLEIDPGDAAAHAALARVLESLGDLEASMRETRLALELDPQLTVALYQKGVLHERAGDDAAAVAAYKQVLEREPDYAEPRLLMANALMRRGDYAEAAAHYEELTRALPDNLQAHYFLALAHLASGNCEQSFAPLSKASDLNMAYGPVVEALVRSYATCSAASDQQKQQALADARWLYQQLRSQDFAEALAMAFAANGAWSEALQLQQQVVQQGSPDEFLKEFRETNLLRYQQQQPATTAWPPESAVYRPARITARQRGSAG